MGNNTFRAIYIALFTAPYLSVFFLIIYLIYNYKTYKRFFLRKSINFYLMVFFLLSAYFMTMMPFPDQKTVEQLNTPYYQLVPFMVIKDYFTDSGVILSDFDTFIPSLKSGAFLGPFLNILMLMPFGYFLREVFNIDLKKSIATCFLVSLIFELTQLSGLFFIYPRPYRIFDVDDLIGNTLGAVIGWSAAPFIRRYSPITRITEGKSLKQGGGVSMRRRVPALVIDQGICIIITVVICIMLNLNKLILFPYMYLIYMLCNTLLGVVLYFFEATPGYSFTRLKLMSHEGKSAALWQCIGHMHMLGASFSLIFWVGYLLYLSRQYQEIIRVIIVLINVGVMLIYIGLVFLFMFNGVTHGMTMYFDRPCKTYMALSPREMKVSRQRLLQRDILTTSNGDAFADEIYGFLLGRGYSHINATRVREFAEKTIHQWIDTGLDGNMCELRFENKMFGKTLYLVLHTKERAEVSKLKEAADRIPDINLSYEKYHNAGDCILTVDIM